jgi:hypothetical protein
MRVRSAASAGVFMLVCAGALTAQAPSAGSVKPAKRFGLIAGVNSASFAGKDVLDESGHTGFRFGGLLVLPVTPSFSIQPEVIYTMKGSEEDQGGGDKAVFKQNYIEVPLLGRYEMETATRFKPLFYFGPSVSYSLKCEASGTSAGVAQTYTCADLEQLAGVTFNKVDAALVLGGGVAFEAAGHVFSVTARYDHGFNKLEKDASVYNRVMSLIGTMEFPFGK